MTVLDPFGRPVPPRPQLEELGRPQVMGIRSLWSSYPSSSLTPVKLAEILKEADLGIVHRQMELAEEVEEKDPHVFSVFQTRKLAVAGLPWEITPGSEAPGDKEIAAWVTEALGRIDNWDEALRDLLDALAKGYAISEIIWEMCDGRAWVRSLAWRHQKWFVFDRETLSELRLITDAEPIYGVELAPYKWVVSRMKARSGILARGSLIRSIVWFYLFKNYDVKDWVTFAEVFGMPLRIGKYPAGASAKDKEVLGRAVSQLGHDAAAIIPEGMEIEFTEATKSGNVNFYESLAAFCDRAISKAVLGQTLTTEQGTVGSQALGNVHDQVRFDLLEADAKALGQTLTRDLVRPLVDFNFGPQASYPAFAFQVEAPEDLVALGQVVGQVVGMGAKVPAAWVHERFGIPQAKEGEEVLTPPSAGAAGVTPQVFVGKEGFDPAGKKKAWSNPRRRLTR